MAVVTDHGKHKPFTHFEPYPTFGRRAPALHGFRLTHAETDHQMVDIAILPGGYSVDISFAPDLQPSMVPDGELDVQLQDADAAEDEFNWRVDYSLLTFPGVRRFQIRDLGCVDSCRQELPAQIFGGGQLPPPAERYLLALTGFKLFFTGNRNHRLDRIGVWFQGRDLNVAFRDHDGGDTFGYLVDFLVIPRVGLSVSTGIERGTHARAFERHSISMLPRSDFMLTGWALNFEQGDHEILDIGVLGNDSGFTVFYGDKGGGDLFDWRVEWAQIGPQVAVSG